MSRIHFGVVEQRLLDEVNLPERDTAEFSRYLVSKLGREVAVEPAPRIMARGLRTDVYAFGLTGRGLSEAWSGPLGTTSWATVTGATFRPPNGCMRYLWAGWGGACWLVAGRFQRPSSPGDGAVGVE